MASSNYKPHAILDSGHPERLRAHSLALYIPVQADWGCPTEEEKKWTKSIDGRV